VNPVARPRDLVVTPTVTIPASELRWRFSRASGAGGQHVNTSDTRVELSWDLAASAALTDTQRARARRRLGRQVVDGVVTVTASERRSQVRNREIARERMAELVARAVAPPPPPRRPTKPTAASRERRVTAKKRRAETKRLRRPPED
jgi:ribosome-associated protein